jgi:hypothetical protein
MMLDTKDEVRGLFVRRRIVDFFEDMEQPEMRR